MNSKVIITLFAVLISIPVQAPVYAQSSAGALFFDEILAKPSLEKRRAEFNKVTRPDVWK
ncbi:MAG: hypothetical protein RBT69_13105 [Spirochaetia bacterium]|nr:hypothetical protein [Spirochaetia bacterium]